MQQAYRPEPRMAMHAYTTYALTRPAATHYRQATCAEVECGHHLRGWQTTVDTGTPLGAKQANYIRLKSGRAFTVTQAGTVVTFTFGAGQACFAEHRLPLHREPLYIVRGGDYRGNPTGERRLHTRGELWVEDFAEHQQSLADEIAKG